MSVDVPKKTISEDSNPVELGFLEELEDKHALTSIYFPSKVGGKPAWLSLQPLPESSILQCKVCSQPLCFLLQIYAPDYDYNLAFHRSIFLFVCRNGQCCAANSADNFVALRCQLPRCNAFYADNAVCDDEEAQLAMQKLQPYSSKLCTVCGCPADNRCSKCKLVVYCSRTHQVSDWKQRHKERCGASIDNTCVGNNSVDTNDFLFSEFELITETEVLDIDEKPAEKSEAERMQEFEQYARNLNIEVSAKNGDTKKIASLAAATTEDLTAMSSSLADKLFKKFSERLKHHGEQVLRYQRGGQPLWATENTPNVVPCCQLCGAQRTFEFQIMPYLLTRLGVDDLGASLDWATVAVYTCSKSCDIPDYGYASEFIWKQDFSE